MYVCRSHSPLHPMDLTQKFLYTYVINQSQGYSISTKSEIIDAQRVTYKRYLAEANIQRFVDHTCYVVNEALPYLQLNDSKFYGVVVDNVVVKADLKPKSIWVGDRVCQATPQNQQLDN